MTRFTIYTHTHCTINDNNNYLIINCLAMSRFTSSLANCVQIFVFVLYLSHITNSLIKFFVAFVTVQFNQSMLLCLRLFPFPSPSNIIHTHTQSKTLTAKVNKQEKGVIVRQVFRVSVSKLMRERESEKKEKRNLGEAHLL